MRNLIKNNGIIIIYISTQLLLFVLALQKDSTIGNSYNLNKALILHIISIILIITGYSVNKKIVFNYTDFKIYDKNFTLKKGFVTICLILITVGLATSILTVGYIISPKEYIHKLINSATEISNIRQKAGDGGLSGIFKMFNYCPLAIYLITSSFITFMKFNFEDYNKLKKINNLSLIASIIKVIFSLDRLTIMAIILTQVYINVVKKKINIKFLIIIISVFLLGVFVTASRMSGSGILDFLIIYCKLSIVNFQMVIQNQSNFSYGFQTFLAPLTFIADYFGIKLNIAQTSIWIYNPAQYLNSYLYIDFGYFSFILYPLIGYFINYVEVNKRRNSLYFVSFYFVLMFTISSFISVPFIRGVEFWLIIIICILLSKFIKKNESIL